MKFFWKIYFSFTVLFLLAFGLFGTWMIQMTFQQSYQKALKDGEWDNRMYQLAFETSLSSMNPETLSDNMVQVIAVTVTQNLSDSGNVYRIYNSSKDLLYERNSCKIDGTEPLSVLSQEQPCSYLVKRAGDTTWLLYACRSTVGGKTYLLESLTNISDIYQERESYYDWYTAVMMGMTVMVTLLVFLISHMLTRSVTSLSQTARRFTEGDLSARAAVSGSDEVAELSADFNRMAVSLSDKIEELTMQAKRQEDFTASFAHELKTPLTSIIGYADMIRSIDCTREETMDAANYIFQQGKRLESLSFKLLELIVAEHQQYQYHYFSVRKLLEEAQILTEEKRKERNISAERVCDDGLIFGEKDLLISLFVNLLDNARKALPENGEIRILGKCRRNGYFLCICDNGCGMAPDEVTRITEAFYMIDKSRARKEGGAGLGMTLCSRIIGLHHARWKIFSCQGKGTVIAIHFPEGEEIYDKED